MTDAEIWRKSALKSGTLTAGVLAAVLLAAGAVPAAAKEKAAAAAPAADLILLNGEIYTPTGFAEAVAVRDGVIVAVGKGDEVSAQKGKRTKVVDLRGATVLPGLHDLHVHPTMAGMKALYACEFEGTATPDEVLATVKACVAKRKPGEWITGGNWGEAMFVDRPPTKEMLDAVAPDNPVVLNDESHHTYWVNSLALERAGITRDTPVPAGGIIDKDANGEPIGLVRETARAYIRNAIPRRVEELEKAVAWSIAAMNAQGITSFVEATLDEPAMAAYARLADKGKLTARVQGCIRWNYDAERPDAINADIINRNLYARERFSPSCVKIYMDGVPLGGNTAAMLEDYHTEPHDQGVLIVPPADLAPMVTRFDRMGLRMKFHAAGNLAARAALDALTVARRANGATGLLHDVGHLTFTDEADHGRYEAIGVVAEFSPYIWYPTPIMDIDVRRALGDAMMDKVYPVRAVLDTGALVVAGSDWPVVPSVSPWLAIETLVTRKDPDNPGDKAIAPRQAISVAEALSLFTVNGARLMGQSHEVGTIAPGMLADLIVIDRNPFRIKPTEISETRVRMTLIEGQVVHQSDDR